MAIVFVTNNSTTLKGTLRSHDGDSVEVLAGAQKVPIDSKFLWRMPQNIVKDQAPVLSVTQKVEEQSNVNEVLKRVQMQRSGKSNPQRFGLINRHTMTTPNPVEEKNQNTVVGQPQDHVIGSGSNPKLSTGSPNVR